MSKSPQIPDDAICHQHMIKGCTLNHSAPEPTPTNIDDELRDFILDCVDYREDRADTILTLLANKIKEAELRGRIDSQEAIKKAERYARANEHHMISRMFSNEELGNLSSGTLSALKRRKKELQDER